MLELILVTTFLALSGIYLRRKWRQVIGRYPPGPWSLPLLGHLHLLGEQPHLSLQEMHAKYGPIVSCDFGSFRGIVLADYHHIKKASNDPSFAGRPKLRVFQERTGGVTKGIIFTEGQEWVEQRRFTLRHLRDFGFGKKTQEALIQDEVDELVAGLKKDAGTPISTRNRFSAAVVNALWTMMTGVRHSQDDEKLQQVLQLMTEAMADPSPASLFMPWLTKLAPEWSGWNYFMRDVKPTIDFLQTFIDEHRSTFVAGQPRDFTDAYLDEIAAATDPSSSFYGANGDISLLATLLDLFFASVETTSHTLSWTILYLALDENRHVQDKAYEEIKRVVGHSRTPCLADRPQLPYTEVTIMEVMRIATVIPLGVWHNTMRDVEFHGYKIPADTMVLTNLYAVHHDRRLWPNPNIFNPSRFLAPDGTKIDKPAAFIPFGTGKRVCIGETLARDQLFLIVSAILQTFTVSLDLDPDEKRPSLLPMPMSPISSPQPHKVIFRLRSH